ncbi:hypothetical protein MKS88_001735 [Plasmodium brasilianum]|uniref:Uncharacterized protein n=1 Tax=Plasmodium brasilianum TaxID=5824 RepID=A0ACB9YC87_PLABR|nr:hypothetical protein MKS88_001735 [Plasmodium brasilianum]
MKQNIKIFISTKIVTFILLSWICYFYFDMITFNKYLYENYTYYKKKDIRNYRLLGIRRKNHVSAIVGLKYMIPNNELEDKKNICNNEKGGESKYELQDEGTSSNVQYNKRAKKNKTYIFETKKYFHIEKQIFKELDFFNFLKNNRTISNKLYENMVLKKYQLRILTPIILLILLSISLILDYCFNCGLARGLYKLLSFSLGKGAMGKFHTSLKSYIDSLFNYTPQGDGASNILYITPFFRFLIYFTSFVIFGIIIISGILYYHKKVKKYEKIIYRKR